MKRALSIKVMLVGLLTLAALGCFTLGMIEIGARAEGVSLPSTLTLIVSTMPAFAWTGVSVLFCLVAILLLYLTPERMKNSLTGWSIRW